MEQFGAFGDAPSSDPNYSRKLALRAIGESLRHEIQRSGTESKTHSASTRSGAAESGLAGLTEVAAPAPLPEFLPTFGLPLPEPISLLRREVKTFTRMGLFSDISRAWVTVDNRVFLWNFVTGKEFVMHEEGSEVITNVALLKPNRDVFQPYVVYFLAVMTPTSITLLGLTFDQLTDVNQSEVKILQLGYTVATPVAITHLAQNTSSTRRIFGAGVDGKLYELEYSKSHTLLKPKIRLIDLSVYFGTLPVLSAIGTALAGAQSVWVPPQEPCQDLVVDQQRQHIFVLKVDSTIDMWTFHSDGKSVKLEASLKHDLATLQEKLFSQAPQQLSPLKHLFCTTGENMVVLVAVAENGDRFHYTTPSKGWLGSTSALSVQERIPPVASLVSSCVSTAFYAAGIFASAHVSRTDPDASDVVSIATVPKVVLPPHQNVKEIVSVEYPTGDPIGFVPKVEAIGEAQDAFDLLPSSDMCSQVLHPPKQLLLLHRNGLSVHIKLRPVDTLHMILDSGEDMRDSLLGRFSQAYPDTDYCAMLVQIACGNTAHDDLLVNPNNNGSPIAVTRRLSYAARDKMPGSLSPEVVGKSLVSNIKKQSARAAIDILRHMSTPNVGELHGTLANNRSLTVTMSPAANGFVAYTARALFSLWSKTIFDKNHTVAFESDEIIRVDIVLSEVIKLLDSLKNDIWSDQTYSSNVHLHWEQNRVTLRFYHHESQPSMGVREAMLLQSTRLNALFVTINTALQALKFLSVIKKMSAKVLNEALKDNNFASTTLGDLITKKEVGTPLAKSIAQALMDAEKSSLVPQFQKLQEIFSTLEQDCAYLFSPMDAIEFRTKMDLSQLNQMGRGNGVADQRKLRELVAGVSQSAGSLWQNDSSALESICTQLVAMEREEEAIDLLLKAAAQVDVSQSALDAYLAQSSLHRDNVDAAAGGSTFQAKMAIVEKVSRILEHLWVKNRKLFNKVMGNSFNSPGSIWSVEASDQVTHFLLFDWLRVERGDETMNAHFRSVLVWANSLTFLEQYLIRNQMVLGKELALFLYHRKHDTKAALNVFNALIRGSLDMMPIEQRHAYRTDCANEALQCAQETHAPDQQSYEKMIEELTTQASVIAVVISVLQSGDPSLRDRCPDADMTNEARAQADLKWMRSNVLESPELYILADRYRNVGNGMAGEVKLRILLTSRVDDQSLWARDLGQLLGYHHERSGQSHTQFLETAKDLLSRFWDPLLFPLGYYIRYVEAFVYSKSGGQPDESVPRLLLEAKLGVETIFASYRTILDSMSMTATGALNYNMVECPFFDGMVPKSHMVHSMAVFLKLAAQSRATQRGLQQPVTQTSHYISDVKAELADQNNQDPNERLAVELADKAILHCEQLVGM